MKRPRGPMTAAEHHAWLKASGELGAVAERQRALDAERERNLAEYKRAEEPLARELRAAGYTIDTVWDLVNMPGSYPRAVPILLAHLPRSYPGPIRNGIARALAVPEAKIGWGLLTKMFRDETDKDVKDGLAVAIANVADAELIGEVIALARDRRHGPSRILLLRALERSKDPRARATLMDLGTDPDLGEEIQVVLRRLMRKEKRKKRRKDDPKDPGRSGDPDLD